MCIARRGDIFHFKFAGSEQRRRAACGRNGIKMVPPILLGSEENAVTHEVEGFVFREIRK